MNRGIKRYLVFSGPHYYPGGGWRDFRGSFDTEAYARAEARRLSRLTAAGEEYGEKWAQVVDTRRPGIIKEL